MPFFGVVLVLEVFECHERTLEPLELLEALEELRLEDLELGGAENLTDLNDFTVAEFAREECRDPECPLNGAAECLVEPPSVPGWVPLLNSTEKSLR